MFGFDTKYNFNNKSLNWLEPVIVQWLKIHRDYLEEYDFEDSLYWYNERANVSALAGSVWKCSGFALEEYSSEKGSDDEKANGRVDLYLSLGGNDVVVEAKLHWLYLHNNQDVNYSEVLSKTHDKAKEDIKKTKAQDPTDQGLALTFVLPYWKQEENIEQQIRNLRKDIIESNHDISVWFHNKTGNSLKSEKGNVFDTVAILGDLA